MASSAAAAITSEGPLEVELPPQSVAELIHHGRYSSRVVRRDEITCPLKHGVTPVRPGAQNIDFELEAGYDIDFKTMRLRLVGASATGGTNTRFEPGMWTIIDSVELKAGGTRLKYMEDFGEYMTMRYKMGERPTSYGKEAMGVGTLAERIAWAAAAQDYIVPLDLLMEDVEIFPRETLLQGQTIIVRINFASVASCIDDDVGAGTETYSIVRPELLYDGVQLDCEARSQMQNAASYYTRRYAETGRGHPGLTFHSQGYEIKRQTINAGATSEQLDMTFKKASIYRMLYTMRVSATVDTTTSSLRLQNWRLDNITEFSSRIQGLLYPASAIETGATTIRRAYDEFLRGSTDQHFDHTPNFPVAISYDKFRGASSDGIDNFIAVIDLRSDAASDILTGLDTSVSSRTVVFQLRSTPISAQHNAELFVEYDNAFVIPYEAGKTHRPVLLE